jgi:DNA mismatch repair protein MutS
MAQVGSFVPAAHARLGIVDKMFSRIGASDDLAAGRSTFMVEMLETSAILKQATARSLVILDEVGRGTSTFDGLAIAWAVVEALAERPGTKVLFATHFHELTQLVERLPGVRNFHVAVREWNDQIIFLHKVRPGGTDRSYGIQVARLAGLPGAVLTRARTLLAELEAAGQRSAEAREATQLGLFTPPRDPLLDELGRLDLAHLTPIEALNLLAKWQYRIRGGEAPPRDTPPTGGGE